MKENLPLKNEGELSIDIGRGRFKKTLAYNPKYKIIPKKNAHKNETSDSASELVISGIPVSIVEDKDQDFHDELKLPVFFPTMKGKNPYVATGRISVTLSDENSAKDVIETVKSIGFLPIELKKTSLIFKANDISPLTALTFCDLIENLAGVSSVTPELLSPKTYRKSKKENNRTKYRRSRSR